MAGLSLWLRSGFAIHAIGESGMDDALFIHLARNLGAGQWLGAFDNTTLVKGMFYPLFILLSFIAGVPLKLAEQGVYLAASACACLLIVRSERGRLVGTALFVVLAFNPVLWSFELSRVIREGLYIGLSLAIVAVATGLATSPGATRPAGLWRGLVLGVLGGCFWLTREEGIWLVPAVATVFVLGLAANGLRALPGLGLGLGVAAMGFAAVVGADMGMNWRVYGVAETVEVKSPAFERGYGALSRISHQEWRRYVVFPKEARALAYKVSPAARELAPSLDGATGEAWRKTGCTAAPMPDCTEIQASWFQWALRDAVKEAGHYASLPEAARFYTQLGQEIDDACDGGAIPCLPRRTGLMPPFRWHYVEDALPAAANLAAILLQPGGDIRREPSDGIGVAVDLFAETAGPVSRGMRSWSIMDARVGARSGPPSISLRGPAGASVRSEIVAGPDPQGAAISPFPLTAVKLVTDCPPQDCDLIVQAGDRAFSLGRIDALTAAPIVQPDLFFEMTQSRRHVSSQGAEHRGALIERIARGIGRVYNILLPAMTVLGTAGVLLAVVFRRGAISSPIGVLAVASAVAVLSRIALLSYVDVSSIASQNGLYASPASPFVIVFAVLGTTLLIQFGASPLGRRLRGR